MAHGHHLPVDVAEVEPCPCVVLIIDKERLRGGKRRLVTEPQSIAGFLQPAG